MIKTYKLCEHIVNICELGFKKKQNVNKDVI